MQKRLTWKVGGFLVIQIREGLYSIARMAGKTTLCVYNIFRESDHWDDVDWTRVEVLFEVFVGAVVQKNLGVRKIFIEGVRLELLARQRYWIDPYSSLDVLHFKGGRGTFPFYGGRLIDVGVSENPETYGAPVIKHDLSVDEDREIIEKYELTNMWGDLDLADRLARYYDTGVNRDDLKFEVFPGLWDDREKLRPLTRRLPVPLR